MKKIYKIDHIEVARIRKNDIPPDVLDALEGSEVLNDMGVVKPEIGAEVYRVSTVKKFATKSKDGYLDENTRIKLAELYFQIHMYDLLMITR